ncbi:hypothetical protein [Paraburkholderia phenoliruptrix]|uniref:hypothetical protein n=1 Tax=Paraburkholderia phenoliruptrix TaxID=252970 RepID=UPI0034CE3EFB
MNNIRLLATRADDLKLDNSSADLENGNSPFANVRLRHFGGEFRRMRLFDRKGALAH